MGAGRGTLSGSGAVRPGPNTPFLKELCGGCGRVGCELHSGREHLQYVKLLRARVVGFEGFRC